MYFWNLFMCWLGFHSWQTHWSGRKILTEKCEHCGIEDDVDLPD